MAREKPAPELSTSERIKRTIAEIGERRREVTALGKQAAELAGSDPEGSIKAEERSAAITRFIARQRTALEALTKQRNAEQFAERDKQINDLIEAKLAETEAVVAELVKASGAFFQGALDLAKIRLPGRNAPSELSGVALLGWQDAIIPTQSPFLGRISNAHAFRRGELARAAAALKEAARNPDFMPVNQSDGICFATLRDQLPPFALDVFELEPEPAAEPVAEPVMN